MEWRDHEAKLLALPPDEEEELLVNDDRPASPPIALNRVMSSRKDGRNVGSECQHVRTSSVNSAGMVGSSSGSGGRRLSLITATATAAALCCHHSQ
jgi:hypothetical protein